MSEDDISLVCVLKHCVHHAFIYKFRSDVRSHLKWSIREHDNAKFKQCLKYT